MIKKKPRILAVTLARGGSKGIINKNIKLLNGQPLIYYTIKEVLKSKLIDRYIVSTDSTKIKNISLEYGAEVPFLRPSILSTGTASAVNADKHALKWAENDENNKYDFFVEIMCTNPFKNVSDIDGILKKIIKNNADSVISVNQLHDHHPIRIKKIVNGKITNFNKLLTEIPETHRQQLKPKAFIRNGSIYASKASLIRKGIRYGTYNSIPYLMPSLRSINIDEPIDFEFANFLMNKNNNE